MFENLGQWLQWIFLLGCVLPLLFTAILTYMVYRFGKKHLDDFVEPDVEKLQAEYVALQKAKPNADRKKLVRQVVNRQAMKCGMVGAVTGFGGFVTLPVTLPIDILLTARMQSTMVGFIAQAYGYESSIENKAATYAVMSGGSSINSMSIQMISKYLPRIVGKSFSKLIPFLGAFISFGLNYLLAQSMARVAIRWYESKGRDEILKPQPTSA